MCNKPVRKQAGAAVVVAMLVVAMAALSASSFMYRSHVEWRRLENLTRQDQAHGVLRAAERWGAAVLRDDARRSGVDHRGEAWATQLPPVEAEGYRVSGRMEDLDARFNLNNLVRSGAVDEGQLQVFIRLLRYLKLPEPLADAVVDWMDADGEPRSQESAESTYYLARPQPYAAANRTLVAMNELLRVRGFDRRALEMLEPFVTLLPSRSSVNVNTARPELIAALVEGLSVNEAYDLVAKRDRSYFRNLQDFLQVLPSGLSAPQAMLSVTSQYFLVRARIRHERLSLGTHALFYREGTNSPTLVWRAEL